MNFIFLVLKRLFLSKQSNFFFRITNIVSIISLAIGIASLSIVLSSVSGFENKVFDKLSNINGYSTINNLFEDTFNKSDVPLPDIVQNNEPLIFEYIEKPAVIKSKHNSNNIIVYGLEKNDLGHFSLLKHINHEKLSYNDVVIGKELANKLKAKKGDPLILVNPISNKSIFDNNKFLFLKIRDIYSSGIYDYDSRLIFMPLSTAQSYFKLENHISGWMIFDKSINFNELDLPFYQVNLKDRHAELFRWINTQKWPIIFIFSLIALVSYFNLLSSINILFYEKRFNLAIMKTYGMSNKKLTFMFTLQGILLALIGSILGIILSYIIVILQEKFHIISLPENIYFVSYLPMTFSIKESFYILGVSIVSSIIFSSFALSQILSINPSRILKN
ncbi:MAG: FtsX-like permease family protein [Candidatus Neomarinimicrobiota bacterium]|nr:FtsX-like permease family protein [Candidatus Neomarinimicrobiota bacterium]|tara:strand:- start:348 stop:1514 length:1167 start_codon:yes stop_codon:yes gene_type:complete